MKKIDNEEVSLEGRGDVLDKTIQMCYDWLAQEKSSFLKRKS